MDVHINEVVSNVRAVDSESLLAPAVLKRIVAAVIQATKEMQRQEKTSDQDTKLDTGEHDGGGG